MAEFFFLNGRSTELAIPTRIVSDLELSKAFISAKNYLSWVPSNVSISSMTIIFDFVSIFLRAFTMLSLSSCSVLNFGIVLSSPMWNKRSDKSYWPNVFTSEKVIALYIRTSKGCRRFVFKSFLIEESTKLRVDVLPVPGWPHKYNRPALFFVRCSIQNLWINFFSSSLSYISTWSLESRSA